MTDSLGLLIVVMVTSAALQDRDGGRLVLERAKMRMPSLVLVWADGGYVGKLLDFAQHRFRILVEIIKRTDKKPTFEVLPRRWVVERTNSWLMRT
ncbi:MAG: transposase [Aeromicrobium sp.]